MSDVQQEIDRRIEDGGISCIEAFEIAERFDLPPHRVREEADRAGVRIFYCQLGLFGFHAFGGKRFIAPLSQVPDRLADALRDAAGDGALSCADAWRVARSEGLPRPVVGSAADALGIRIDPCQLGCFGSPQCGETHAE